MAELVFATEMKGNLAPVEGQEGTFTFRANGTGPNGEAVTTQSDVVMEPDGFKETGTIEYAGRGKVFFETVGLGTLSPSPVADLSCGAVVWRITGGEGEFQGASGHITSNFAVTAAGEAVDNNYSRIFLP
ncbi:MAG: hypothetical protein IH870_07060 [Chloroflexi bacterium]|nr:hypothetical protein [Chloroflexota bacterium]